MERRLIRKGPTGVGFAYQPSEDGWTLLYEKIGGYGCSCLCDLHCRALRRAIFITNSKPQKPLRYKALTDTKAIQISIENRLHRQTEPPGRPQSRVSPAAGQKHTGDVAPRDWRCTGRSRPSSRRSWLGRLDGSDTQISASQPKNLTASLAHLVSWSLPMRGNCGRAVQQRRATL